MEEGLDAREIELAVLGNDEPEPSVVGEIIPDREFYDYDSKYSAESRTELRIPAPLERGRGARGPGAGRARVPGRGRERATRGSIS